MHPSVWAARLPWSIPLIALVLMSLGWFGLRWFGIVRSEELATSESTFGLVFRGFDLDGVEAKPADRAQ
jgi:hypothetical protein